MRTPVLRAITSTEEHWDDPSEDMLFMLFEDLKEDQDYFIVQRVADPDGQTYAQVMKTNNTYLVERREGAPDKHFHAVTAEMRAAHEDMTTWAFELDRPFVLPWAPGMG